jgi:hypothetical protein
MKSLKKRKEKGGKTRKKQELGMRDFRNPGLSGAEKHWTAARLVA